MTVFKTSGHSDRKSEKFVNLTILQKLKKKLKVSGTFIEILWFYMVLLKTNTATTRSAARSLFIKLGATFLYSREVFLAGVGRAAPARRFDLCFRSFLVLVHHVHQRPSMSIHVHRRFQKRKFSELSSCSGAKFLCDFCNTIL